MIIRNAHKILSLVAVSSLLFAFTVAPTDYSGTWKLNEGKSELGQFGARGAASKITIEQKAEDITVMRSLGTVELKESLVNGKEVESAGFNNSKKKATLKWAADGQTFVVNGIIAIDMNGQSFELTTVENWSLSADGKTLTLQTTITTPQGEFSTKGVYDKQ
jgi:hypothetical protein